MTLVQRLLREPLMHFLAIGASLFLVFGLVSEPGPDPADTIVVGPDQIEQLRTGYQAVWKRPPTNDLIGPDDDRVRRVGARLRHQPKNEEK